MPHLATKQFGGAWAPARFVGRAVVNLISQVLSAVILLPILGFTGYDLLYFETRTDEIRRILASASEDERNPPEIVASLTRIAHRHISLEAARTLVMELNVSPPEKGMLHWHATNLLWWNLVSLHLPKREQIALVASRPGRGYSAASQSLFRRPLFALSADEAATVVALAFAPNYYRAHPERLAQRRDFLLSKLQSSPSPKE